MLYILYAKSILKFFKYERGLFPLENLENCNFNQYCLQQNLYKRLQITNIENKIDLIVKYFNDVISKKINWIDTYTYDFAIVDNMPYFIEMNSFGKEYAAGSALFHWLHDEKILYNDYDDTIEFRYTV